jgi:integrase
MPSYRLHKQSGQAVVTLSDIDGNRRDVLLGKHGTPESEAEYLRVVGEWKARGRRLPSRDAGSSLRVNELLEAFLTHAERHYRGPDGQPTTELRDYLITIRSVRLLYGLLPAADFSPLKLKALRQQMVSDGLCRAVVNQRIGRITRIFRWAVSEELVPEATWRALTAVRGLARGRTDARETEPIGPVADAAVEATLPFLTRPVRAMIRLQRLTGMRPGEACRLRACDLDTTGDTWVYRPPHHKTAHRGKTRVIALGPQAQAIVRLFLNLETQAHLFSPKAAVEGLRRDRRAARKTKVQPSQRDRSKPDPERTPQDRYTTAVYGKAVARACDRAFPPPAPLGRAEGETVKAWRARLTSEQRAELRAWRKAHRWHPNQLRHAHATEVRRRFGLEAAQVALGHSQANVTQVYAERDLTLATRVAQAIG